MLKNVKLFNGVFEAYDEMNRRVFITESISFLFQAATSEDDKRVTYKALYYKQADILEIIEDYLRGRDVDMDIVDTIVVRFGWMDKRLNKLSFMSLTDLMKKIKAKEATSTEKRKLTAICKQLGLSLNNVAK